jgi:transposase-like protein
MKKFSTTKIVRDEIIYKNHELRSLKISEAYINDMFSSNERGNIFLVKVGIFYNSAMCSRCEDTSLKYVKRKPSPDGYHWECKRACRNTLSLRSGSIFEGSRLPMRTLFLIMYKYLNRTSMQDIAFELNVNRGTVAEYADLVREAIAEHIFSENERLGGLNPDGTNKVVEIDESLFFKRKYSRGRLTDGQWYIGGIERGSKKAFIVPVQNRNTETIRHVINENVHPGTIVITDQWRAYSSALSANNDFEHRSVNHSLNFVDPEDPTVHTQTIEGLWSHMKKFLRGKSGISKEQQSEYLLQFIWEHKIEVRMRFNVLLELLKINS